MLALKKKDRSYDKEGQKYPLGFMSHDGQLSLNPLAPLCFAMTQPWKKDTSFSHITVWLTKRGGRMESERAAVEVGAAP